MRKAKKERAKRRVQEEAEWLNFPEAKDSDPGIDFFTMDSKPAELESPAKNPAPKPAPKPAPAPVEKKTETPSSRISIPDYADDDFFDSFFKD